MSDFDSTRFASFWYPDFIGIAYGFDRDNFLVAPYFDNESKAKYVYDIISRWNSNFIKMRFIEYGKDNYAFIAYQDPQGSFHKINFGLYRSSMTRSMSYSKYKPEIQKDVLPRLGVLFSKNPSDPSSWVPIGPSLKIGDCKIINEDDLKNAEMKLTDYALEKLAHELCKAKDD